MVRKVSVVIIALAVVLSVAAPARAVTPEIYDGTISTSMLDYFRDILAKVNPLKNYVLLRTSQYTYNLYCGEMEWDGVQFTAESADVYTITTNSGYNSHYTFAHSTVSGLTVRPGDHIVYSDLGSFPGLRDPAEYWGFYLSVAAFILIIGSLIRSMWRWRG